MKVYKVWLFPALSARIEAESRDQAEQIASSLSLDQFHEHTDMCEISIEETEND